MDIPHFDCESWMNDSTINISRSEACIMYRQIKFLQDATRYFNNYGFNSVYRFHVEILNFLHDTSKDMELELCKEHANIERDNVEKEGMPEGYYCSGREHLRTTTSDISHECWHRPGNLCNEECRKTCQGCGNNL
jgi:hypothetical protein